MYHHVLAYFLIVGKEGRKGGMEEGRERGRETLNSVNEFSYDILYF
jgi:hypothetical protein